MSDPGRGLIRGAKEGGRGTEGLVSEGTEVSEGEGVLRVEMNALTSEGEETVMGIEVSKVEAVIPCSVRTWPSHRPSLAASRAPSASLYALTLKSPPFDREASWMTRIALPRPAAFSTAERSSIDTRVAKPPLWVER